jgi:GNAT superfamily N-acetyltransferase
LDIKIEPGKFDALRRPGWEWDDHPDVVVGRIDGELAVALRLFPRLLVSRSIKFTAIGIGGVFTKTKFRSMGFATELIEWTLRNSQGRFACACLFSSRGDSDNVYKKVGFFPIKNFFYGRLYCMPLLDDVFFLDSHEWQLDPPGHF